MPSEVGVGYQGPPEIRDAYGPETERERSLEDYVSRRIFANLARSSDQFIPILAATAVSWHFAASTDSSSLFTADGTSATVPEGANGDYMVSLQVTWRTRPANVLWSMWIAKNAVAQAQIESTELTGAICTDMSLSPGDIVTARVYTYAAAGSGDTGYSISWDGAPLLSLNRPPTTLRIRRLL